VCNGSEIVFDQFALPRAMIEQGEHLSGAVTFSVRPQSIKLTRDAGGQTGARSFAVTVTERAYLGEYWNYVVVPRGGATPLRVTTPPLEVYEVGEAAWLELDPRQMAAIS
jgi:iron(III) transport system ATP-binding protein